MDLLCGIQVKGSVSLSASDVERLNGQLVRVSSSRKGGLSLTRLTGGVSGELNVAERKLGSRNLADNVVVFQNDGSGLTAISLSQIADGSVPASQITYAGTDWAGRVKVIVLNSAIGGGYIFGRANYTANYDEEGNREGNAQLSVEYGAGKSTPTFETGYVVRNGDIVGITIVTSGNTQRIGSLVYPDELRNVPNTAWSGKGARHGERPDLHGPCQRPLLQHADQELGHPHRGQSLCRQRHAVCVPGRGPLPGSGLREPAEIRDRSSSENGICPIKNGPPLVGRPVCAGRRVGKRRRHTTWNR